MPAGFSFLPAPGVEPSSLACPGVAREEGLTVGELLTTAEVATAVRRSAYYVRRLVREGRLPARRLTPGGPLLIRREDVEAMLQPAMAEREPVPAAV
jgi:excisionase family DNA binding protein